MCFVHNSRILRILPQFRKLQAAVLEFLYFFFEWHYISAGNHAFSFITCNELTLSMDFCVQVDGSAPQYTEFFWYLFLKVAANIGDMGKMK